MKSPYPKFCNRCGVDLQEPIGLCARCANHLGIKLQKRRNQIERLKRQQRESSRDREQRVSENERAYNERVVAQKKARAAKRNREVFPRSSAVTVTRADGATEIVPAYNSPAALRKVAPERLPIPEEMRAKILYRDWHACRYCGNDSGPFEMDHVIPVALGGATSMSNLVTACGPCNSAKGANVWKPRPLPRTRKAA